MPICIYCRAEKDATGFTKEHVLHVAFGRFRDALTLVDAVCGDCNQVFANDLDRYLTRDTIDGLNRFRGGHKSAAEYKSEGKRSTLEFKLDSGPFKGLRVIQRPVDGQMLVQPLPQVGFSLNAEGPYEWYLRDQLPTKEDLKAKFPAGSNLYIEFFEVDDPPAVMDELRRIGLGGTEGPLNQSRPAGWRGPITRVQSRQILADKFARAVSKICFNYLAHQWGPAAALMSQFDEIRRFIRYGEKPGWFQWQADGKPLSFSVPHSNGHVVAVAFDEANKNRVVGITSIHLFARYRMILAPQGFELQVPDRAHFYDLDAGTCVPLRFGA